MPQRTRLFRRLGEGRVVVLRAPLGYGKTTLIRQWLDSLPADTRVVWSDSSTPDAAAHFWRRLHEQLKQVTDNWQEPGAPGGSAPHRPATSVATVGEQAAEDGAYAAVRYGLAAVPERPTVFVLDAFYHSDDAQTRARLAQLQADHAELRIVAASRLQLGLAESTEATVLTADDLAFDARDVIDLAHGYGIALDEAWAQAIVDVLGAWPALIDRVVRTLAARPGAERQMADALGALSEEWDGLLGDEHSDELARADAARPARAENGPRAAEDLSRDEQPGDPRTFAGTLADALEVQDWRTAAGLLEESLPDLLEADANLAMTALCQLPARAVREYKRTRAVRRIVHAAIASGNADEATQGGTTPLVDLANIAGGSGVVESFEAALVGSVVLRRAGYFLDAARVAHVARLAMDANDHRLPGRFTALAPAARTQLTLSFALAGRFAEAAEQLSLALKAAEAQPHSNATELNWITGLFSVKAALEGDLEDAQAWADRYEPGGDVESTFWLMPVLPAARPAARAIIAIDLLDRTAAEKELARLRPEEPGDELWALTVWAQVGYGMAWGDYAGAYRALEMAGLRHREWAYSRGPGMSWLVAATANLLIASGEGSRANALLRKSSSTHPAVRLASARLDYLAGDDVRVLALTREIVRTPGLTDRCRLEALLLRACATTRSKGLDEAEPLWWSACDLAEHMGGPLFPFAMVDATVSEAAAARVGLLEQFRSRCCERGVDGLFPERLQVLRLTNRESDVLEKLAEGVSVASIAKSHFVAPSTIKSQLRTLYGKLGVHSREEAVRVAREAGLL